jgi:hypothetical protein
MFCLVSNIELTCPACKHLFPFTCPSSFIILSLGQCALDLKALLVLVSYREADQNCHLTLGFWKWLLASPKQLSWCAFYPGFCLPRIGFFSVQTADYVIYFGFNLLVFFIYLFTRVVHSFHVSFYCLYITLFFMCDVCMFCLGKHTHTHTHTHTLKLL